ncbi:MarR family winged helix-turn-helix transcriptional regulator [Streptomyces sp. NPDC088261]|uniref:MarR family winged helix-turn-helix transcriptional regulator n=1 Tax=Streptomyces sp. NPDC088261 TaxID=3365851 RepID=UPI00382ABE82
MGDPPQEGDPGSSPEGSGGGETVRQLADGVDRLMRMFVRTRAQLLDRARDDVDWSVQIVMGALVKNGPMRVTKLAELVHSDPSTVSRHVAQLVRDGFLERRADADDGRACLLVATDKARHAVADRTRSRDVHFEKMLHAWDDHDRERLAALLVRFIDDFETYKNVLADKDWKGLGPAAGREESTA